MHTPTKLIYILALALAAVSGASAHCSDENHRAHHPQAAASMASKPVGMAGMHDIHEKHQKEMKKIHDTKDPAKRQKLMDQHMKEMHEHMDKNCGMGAPMGATPMQGAASK